MALPPKKKTSNKKKSKLPKSNKTKTISSTIAQEHAAQIEENKNLTPDKIFVQHIKNIEKTLKELKNSADSSLQRLALGYSIKRDEDRLMAMLMKGGTPITRINRERVIILEYTDPLNRYLRTKKIISDRYLHRV